MTVFLSNESFPSVWDTKAYTGRSLHSSKGASQLEGTPANQRGAGSGDKPHRNPPRVTQIWLLPGEARHKGASVPPVLDLQVIQKVQIPGFSWESLEVKRCWYQIQNV